MKRVDAIRADALVGRGTCTSIDECFDTEELMEELDRDSITDPAKAVEWARDQEELHLEMGLNQRWGDDDDPQLLAWREFRKARGKSV